MYLDLLDFSDPHHLSLILAETARRAEEAPDTLFDFADYSFPNQAKAIHNPYSKFAVFCPRRSGKSQTIARRLAQQALNQPDTPCLYVGLTNQTCRRIFWNDAWKQLKRAFDIPGKTYRDGVHEFPNGSTIFSLGMDADEEQMGKLLGGQYKEVGIDEAQKFRVSVENLVYEVLEPATIDLGGAIGLYGTPDDYLDGLFYEVTRTDGAPRRSDWEVFEWTPIDNPYMADKWAAKVAEIKRHRPEYMKTPAYRRMYLGEWVVDGSKRIYKHSDSNIIQSLPRADFHYVIGVDLGFDDETAYGVLAYTPYGREVYVCEIIKQKKALMGDVRAMIKHLMRKYRYAPVVVDGASKQFVETLKQTYGLPLIATEKVGKHDFIEALNSDLISGRIKLIDSGTKDLQAEWEKLIWFFKNKKKMEHPNLPNHASDAVLYAWRYIYSYQSDTVEQVTNTEEEKILERIENESAPKDSSFDNFYEYHQEYDPFDEFGMLKGV